MTLLIIILSLYLVYYDILYKRVPNSINFILLLSILVYKIYLNQNLLIYIISALLAFSTFFLIHIISHGGMGIGDCKYTALIAMNFGYYFWLQSLIITSVTAIIVSIVLLKFGIIDRKTKIPFIPFLVFGWLIIFLNNTL